MAERFSAIDYRSHVTPNAETVRAAGGSIIGDARDTVDGREPAVCKFAIAVADRWCSIRLGCMLLERLVDRTVRPGIPRMSADTVANNRPMRAQAGRAGFARARKREDGRLVRLVKEPPTPDRCASRRRPGEIAGAA